MSLDWRRFGTRVLIHVSFWVCGTLSAMAGLFIDLKFPSNSQPGLSIAFGVAALLVAAFGVKLAWGLKKKPAPVTVLSAGFWMALTFGGSLIVTPVFRSARQSAADASCRTRLRHLSFGVVAYTADWDDRLPPASHWRTLAEGTRISDWDSDRKEEECPERKSPFGYALNRPLAERSLSSIEDFETVLLFESEAQNKNAVGESRGLAVRHHGSHFVARCDGSVKRYVPGYSGPRWKP